MDTFNPSEQGNQNPTITKKFSHPAISVIR